MGTDKFKATYEIFSSVSMLNAKIHIEKEIIFRLSLNCARSFTVCVVDRERR